jgi:hypothetical protein
MNERIKELAEQAGIEVWGGARYVYHPSETLDSTVVTKFVMIIVSECAGIYDAINNGNLHLGTDDYLEALIKHFGVKE